MNNNTYPNKIDWEIFFFLNDSVFSYLPTDQKQQCKYLNFDQVFLQFFLHCSSFICWWGAFHSYNYSIVLLRIKIKTNYYLIHNNTLVVCAILCEVVNGLVTPDAIQRPAVRSGHKDLIGLITKSQDTRHRAWQFL